jgi:hypothetical protein
LDAIDVEVHHRLGEAALLAQHSEITAWSPQTSTRESCRNVFAIEQTRTIQSPSMADDTVAPGALEVQSFFFEIVGIDSLVRHEHSWSSLMGGAPARRAYFARERRNRAAAAGRLSAKDRKGRLQRSVSRAFVVLFARAEGRGPATLRRVSPAPGHFLA